MGRESDVDRTRADEGSRRRAGASITWFETPAEYFELMWRHMPWVVAVQASVFWYFGLYRGIWRFASLPDLKRITLAVLVAAGGITALLFMLRIAVPRSVLVLDPLLLATTMAGSRLIFRMHKERRFFGQLPTTREPVIVLGAGVAGAKLIAELALSRAWQIVGVLDDDPMKRGRQVYGVTILGPLSELALWSERFSITKAIIAFPGASHQVRRRAAEICAAAEVEPMRSSR